MCRGFGRRVSAGKPSRQPDEFQNGIGKAAVTSSKMAWRAINGAEAECFPLHQSELDSERRVRRMVEGETT